MLSLGCCNIWFAYSHQFEYMLFWPIPFRPILLRTFWLELYKTFQTKNSKAIY